jgi:tetratricopeptide (TPR) repeat protein
MVITLPDYPDLLANVGSACRMANLFDEAVACLNRSLHLNLARTESWNNRGQVHEDLGEFAEAYTCYQNAYSLNRKEYPSVALALAYSRMRLGEWSNDPWLPAGAPEGTEPFPSTWDLWEQGRAPYVEANALPGVPMWKGDDLAGDRLLITHEGGFGDYVWLSRYLPKLADLVGDNGGYVFMLVPETLLRLAKQRFCPYFQRLIIVSDYTQIKRQIDWQVPLLSLLTRFLRDTRNVPPVSLLRTGARAAITERSS